MAHVHRLGVNDTDPILAGERRIPGRPAEAAVRPGLLRIDEAADWLGLSKRKTYELLRRGEIQSVYIGRSRRIAFAALQRFVERLSEGRG